MPKVTCEECGCAVRMTRKWLEEAGAPTCGCGGEMQQEGGAKEVKYLLGQQKFPSMPEDQSGE